MAVSINAETCTLLLCVCFNRCSYVVIFWYICGIPPSFMFCFAKKRIVTVNFSAHLTLDSCLERCYLWAGVKPPWHTHLLLCAQRGQGRTKWGWTRLPQTFPSQDSKVIPKGFIRSKWLLFYHPTALRALAQELFDPGIPIVTDTQCSVWLNKAGWGVQASLSGVDRSPLWQLCVCVCVYQGQGCQQGLRDTIPHILGHCMCKYMCMQ